MESTCNYQRCLTCPIDTCWTGEIARSRGIEGYNEHIKMLDEAEMRLHSEKD